MDVVRKVLRLPLRAASGANAAESYRTPASSPQTIIVREQPANIGVHYAGSVHAVMMSFQA